MLLVCPSKEVSKMEERLSDIISSSDTLKVQQPIIFLRMMLKINFERAQNGYAFMQIEFQSIDDRVVTKSYQIELGLAPVHDGVKVVLCQVEVASPKLEH